MKPQISLLSRASLAFASLTSCLPLPALLRRAEKRPKERTQHDLDRIEAARAKREHKAEKKAANIAKSIANNPCLRK